MKTIKLPVFAILFFFLCAGCDTALERNLAGKQVNLLAPVNNLVTTDTSQTFYWDNLDGATKYQLRVVSPRFDSITRLIIDTIITRNSFLINLHANSYQWRVTAMNDNTSSDAGEARNLRIQ